MPQPTYSSHVRSQPTPYRPPSEITEIRESASLGHEWRVRDGARPVRSRPNSRYGGGTDGTGC